MNKREFLKASGAIITGTMLSRVAPAEPTTNAAAHRTNWSGNLTYHTDHLLQPTTVEEVQQAVKSCTKVRALGARHSFNTIADSNFNQISVKALQNMSVDAKARTVTVGGGVTYGGLSPWLDSQGFAVPNLASLPHVSVAGACATATHGSGNKNGNLSTSVAAVEIVTADGNLVHISRETDGDQILGAAVALGGLGVITSTTLDVIPRFDMAQVVYENLSFDQLEHNLEAIFGSGYSVSLFTDWQKNRATQVWIKSRLAPGGKADMPAQFYGATLAKQKLHPITGASAINCTEQQGIPGPWYERMPHFRMNFTPSSGNELQTEYFVPRDKGYAAIRAVEELRDHITPHLFVTEFRTIAADNIWMSTCHNRDAMTLHFTWKPDWPSVKKVLPLIEAKLAPFDARPHWAKMFTMQPSHIQKLYEKLPDYQAMLKHYDPNGKFRNDFLNTNIFSA
ncbi:MULTISPECIES: FAD-binding protein [Acidobacteriaceae]|uniref:FAD-binding protein n=1 Tax=Acidobacteriaceae TaxID=204434 RepID=UPI00131BBB29|nr:MULTISPECIES: FAD-binding protein [Acidobacteriaceae]MDW5267943.1 FAD-binding protein [Edaphobacter sp.]